MIKTDVIKIDPKNPDIKKIEHAASVLKNGGLVAFPTETVYGLGANLDNKKSMNRLVEIKHRPEGKLFSIHIGQKGRIEDFVNNIPVAAYKLIDKFWPGPLTIILNSKKNNKQTIGIRMPANKIALDLINMAAVPIVAPSANVSGKNPPTTIEEVLHYFKGKIDVAIDGGKTELGVSSSIIDFTMSSSPEITREGAIKKSEIEKVLNTKNILFVCTGNSCRSVMAEQLLKKKLGARDDVKVFSAGIGVMPGMGASQETQRVLDEFGIDASAHRSRQLTDDIINKSDIILVMQKLHEQTISKQYPSAKNRLYLLKEFAKIDDGDLDIHDPMGKTEEFYRATFLLIKEAIDKIAQLIQG